MLGPSSFHFQERPPFTFHSCHSQAQDTSTRAPPNLVEMHYLSATDWPNSFRFTIPIIFTLTSAQMQLQRGADAATSRRSSPTASTSRLQPVAPPRTPALGTRSVPPMMYHAHTAPHSPHVRSVRCGANRQ